MKARFFFQCISLFWACACTAAPLSQDPPIAGKIISPVICKKDPSQSYALYIPARGNASPLPVIYFFDPHADGALPLRKYKALADAYGFILAGSNNSKNGNDWTTTEKIWRVLSDDLKGRLKIMDNRVYTCGFSGGAKVAGYIAIQHTEIKGVIAGGAGLPDGVGAQDLGFSFTAMAGEGDMNLTDLAGFTKALDGTHTRHRIILFDGKHEWAPEASMNTAFAGLQFDAMQAALIPRDDGLIQRYIAKSRKRVDSCNRTGRLLKAMQECRLSVSLLSGLTRDVGWFQQQAASLADNKLYQEQQRAQEDLLAREQNIKAEYMQHFQLDDMVYWTRTIRDLQKSAGTRTAEGPMYSRLLAYLSLAFYSLSSHSVGSNQDREGRHFVGLYKMADPDNGEAWYLSAVLNARDKQVQAAENDLLKAAGYGFRDRDRMRRQPEFQHLPVPINFSRIESRMHAH